MNNPIPGATIVMTETGQNPEVVATSILEKPKLCQCSIGRPTLQKHRDNIKKRKTSAKIKKGKQMKNREKPQTTKRGENVQTK